MHKSLPVDEMIQRVGVNFMSRCVYYGCSVENHEHLFFQGGWAKQVWKFLDNKFMCGKPSTLQDFIRIGARHGGK